MNKENLEYMKRQIDIILDEVYENRDKLKIAKGKFEEGVIINGKPFGEEKIERDLSQLDLIIDNLTNVCNHCNQKLELIEQNKNNGNIDFRGDY